MEIRHYTNFCSFLHLKSVNVHTHNKWHKIIKKNRKIKNKQEAQELGSLLDKVEDNDHIELHNIKILV